MKFARFAFAVLLASTSAIAQTAVTPAPDDSAPVAPPIIKAFDPAAMDLTADPCSDFYQYACGNWMKTNPIPSDQVRWMRSFLQVRERNRYLLWQELDAAAKDPKTPLQKQYGDFYASCMDTDTIEKRGMAPIEPSWKMIAGLTSVQQLPELMADLENHGTPDGFFGFSVSIDDKDSSKQIAEIDQGGFSLPDRDYYLVDNPHFATIRSQYIEHMKKMFTLAGDTPDEAAKEAAAVMEIETAMAKASMSRTDLRQPTNTYHIMTLAELDQLAPAFTWSAYFHGVGIGHFDTLNVGEPDYFKALSGMLQSEPLEGLKSYLRWQVLHGQAEQMPKTFFDENFAFFNKTLSGQDQPQARWKRCSSLTDNALGEAVGQDWVQQNFPPAAKDSMDKLVLALEKAMGEDLQTVPWMSDDTKKAAEQKLAMIRNKIGYPEKWKDYSSVKVNRGELIENIHHVAVFERDYNFHKLGKPVDEKEWQMTPPTVNAYYDDSFNDINFPAGILQPPFFDVTADPAVNFGGIGTIIGHEMTHGFDDQGAQFDGKGNLRQWQTDTDLKAFKERTECVASEYSGFQAAPAKGDAPAQNLNGHLTLGENTADNGGLRIAYMALLDTLAGEHQSIDEKIGGFTEAQRYFISFAQDWCQNHTDAYARQAALVDPHSPGKWRVNGSVQNFEEFGKVFGCKKGQPMYPVNACRVW